jgi:hypothetical protein
LSADVYVFDTIVRILHRSTQPIDNSIYPRINIRFEITNISRTGTAAVNINIVSLTMKLQMIKQGVLYRIGELVPDQTFFSLPSGAGTVLSCDLPLDHYGLGQIEKLRANNDLTFRTEGIFISENQQQPQSKVFQMFTLDFRIPKSDWVEDILPRLKYKDVILIEVPKILEPQFQDVMTHLNGAWKQYSMGEYDKVLVECRKALENLNEKMKSAGFESESTNGQGAKNVPDWNKLMGNSELGDTIGTVSKKLKGFVAPGAHTGRTFNREDADFALMTTHAIVNLVTRKLLSDDFDKAA